MLVLRLSYIKQCRFVLLGVAKPIPNVISSSSPTEIWKVCVHIPVLTSISNIAILFYKHLKTVRSPYFYIIVDRKCYIGKVHCKIRSHKESFRIY